MKGILLGLFLSPLCIFAQVNEHGVQFMKDLNWDQVKAEARAENKYIFVDAYTSWCGPCKMMDNYVFPNDTLGRLMNEKFISIKIQMDSTISDESDVRNWYSTARQINHEYNIEGYPTFLFFSPSGNLIYKGIGYMSSDEFEHLSEKALDSNNEMKYVELEAYKKGVRDYRIMPQMAIFAKNIRAEKDWAARIASDYYTNFFIELDPNEMCSPSNIEFMSNFINQVIDLIHDTSTYFKLCYEARGLIDSLVSNNDWAQEVVEGVIEQDELSYRLMKTRSQTEEKPDWDALKKAIKGKFSKVNADKLVDQYRIKYYLLKKDWTSWFFYQNQRIISNSKNWNFMDRYMEMNGNAWDVFLYCNDVNILGKATKWIDMMIYGAEKNGDNEYMYDTKANLLYKAGNVAEGVRLEKIALKENLQYVKSKGESENMFTNNYRDVIRNMENREPTYLEQGADWDMQSLARIGNRKSP